LSISVQKVHCRGYGGLQGISDRPIEKLPEGKISFLNKQSVADTLPDYYQKPRIICQAVFVGFRNILLS